MASIHKGEERTLSDSPFHKGESQGVRLSSIACAMPMSWGEIIFERSDIDGLGINHMYLYRVFPVHFVAIVIL